MTNPIRHNCLILGSGRSGTSLLAGTLHSAGYYLGDQLLPPGSDNPKGFYEDREVNSINEVLLSGVTPPHPPGSTDHADNTVSWGWRWLADVPVDAAIACTPILAKQIRKLTSNTPYCFKDPRLCYTLPVWRPYLDDCVFLCVFREPAHTAHSILKVCERGEYLHGLEIDFDEALQRWMSMYRRVLDIHCKQGDWLFLHYHQILGGSGIPQLETFLNTRIESDFADTRFAHVFDGGDVPHEVVAVYQQLCELARYNPDV